MVRGEGADGLRPNMRVMGIIAGLIALTALAVAILVMRPDVQSEAGLFRPDDRRLVQLGEVLYQEHCSACHGTNLEGETPDWRIRDEDGFLPGPPHDETGHTWHHADRILFDITKYGIGEAANLPDYATRMPTFEDVLDDEEIIAILSFIKSRWPPRVRQYQDELNRRTQERGASEE